MIGAFAAGLSVLAFVDPRLRGLIWAALLTALVSLIRDRRRVFLPLLAFTVAVPALAGFSTGADSLNYFAYTSSILADRDLDFANQWARLGFETSSRTSTGLVPNAMAAGPGLIWTPAVALAHAWLSATGGATDPLRLSGPYYAAAAATTLGFLLAAVLLLVRTLSSRFGDAEARLAVFSVVFASPLLYYAAVQPLMAHALAFAFAGCGLALTLRAERDRTLSAWALSGGSVGLAMLCRAQAAPLLLIVVAGLGRTRAGWKPALAAAFAAFAFFSPQLLAWKILYGSFVTIPQGAGFIDWTGRHALDVLVSADRGLFNWHPLMILGLLGLLFAMKGLGAYAVSALAVFGFTAFLNGSVRDWNASAAFGARRFDLVLPLLALGLAALLSRLRPMLASRPFLLPALALALAAAWNLSLIDLGRGRPASALPLDDLARLQAGQARRLADASFGRLGPRARDLVYRAFVGLFVYENYRPGGEFDLATLEPRFLKGGWSEARQWDDGAAFRYLLFPEGCIVIPLNEPFDLRGFVRARSPARIENQRVTLILNGRPLSEADLPARWTDLPFEAPERFWRSGENEFCVRAAKRRPGDEGDDLAYAAAVVGIQLP